MVNLQCKLPNNEEMHLQICQNQSTRSPDGMDAAADDVVLKVQCGTHCLSFPSTNVTID